LLVSGPKPEPKTCQIRINSRTTPQRRYVKRLKPDYAWGVVFVFDVLLGCNAVGTCRQTLEFRTKILPPPEPLVLSTSPRSITTQKTNLVTLSLPVRYTNSACTDRHTVTADDWKAKVTTFLRNHVQLLPRSSTFIHHRAVNDASRKNFITFLVSIGFN
jgi:hypothetical protein